MWFARSLLSRSFIALSIVRGYLDRRPEFNSKHGSQEYICMPETSSQRVPAWAESFWLPIDGRRHAYHRKPWNTVYIVMMSLAYL